MIFNDFNLLNENVADAKKWLTDNNIEVNNPAYIEIRDMVQKNQNLTLLFTKFHFKDKIKIDELKTLYTDLVNNKNILNKLSKPVIKYDSFEELTDNLRDLITNQSFIRFENELPQVLQSAIQTIPEEKKEKFKSISKEFFTLDKATRKIFTDKISRYKSTDDLLDAYARFVSNSKSDFTYEKTLEQLKKVKGAIIKYKDPENEILVVRLLNYQASQSLCSLTSWCIKDYESSWNTYVGGEKVFNTQYAIFNFSVPYFDNYSMIGVTINQDGSVKTAHLKNDERIYDEQLFRYTKSLGIPRTTFSAMGKREGGVKMKLNDLFSDFKVKAMEKKDGFDNPIFLKKAKAITNILLNQPNINILYEEGILVYIAIKNDDLDFFKLLVSGGLDINTTIQLYNPNNKYSNREYSLLLYDIALLKKADKIKAYLDENNAKKINYKVSYYLNYYISNNSEEEIIKLLSTLDKSEINETYILRINEEEEFNNMNISYYKDELSDFIFRKCSLDVFKYLFNILNDEDKKSDTNIINSVCFDLGKNEKINSDKVEFLLNNSPSVIKMKNNENDFKKFDFSAIDKIFLWLLYNDFEIVKKYKDILINYAKFKISGELMDIVMFDIDELSDFKYKGQVLFLFDIGIIPSTRTISNNINKIIKYIIDTKDSNKLKNLFDNKYFDMNENYLMPYINNYDNFMMFINNGIIINNNNYDKNNISLYHVLLANYENSYGYNKYLNNIDDKVLDYIIKNTEINTDETLSKKNYTNGNSSSNKVFYIKVLIEFLLNKNKDDMLLYILEKYDLPDLATDNSSTYKTKYYTFYNSIIKKLNSLNRIDLITKINNRTKELNLDLKVDISDIIKNDEDEDDEEVVDNTKVKDTSKIKSEIKKLHDLGLEISKGSIQSVFDSGDMDLLDYVINLGIPIYNSGDTYENADIGKLIKTKNLPMIKKIYQQGYKMGWGFYFDYAVDTNDLEIVKFILENDNIEKNYLKKGVKKAIAHNNEILFNYIYDKSGLTPDDFETEAHTYSYGDDSKPLLYDIIKNSGTTTDFLKNILDKKFEVTEKVILYAFDNKRLDIIKYFVDNNYLKLNDKYLSKAYKSDILQYLIDNGIIIDENTDIKTKEAIFDNILSKGTNTTFVLLLEKFGELFKDLNLTQIISKKILQTSNKYSSPEDKPMVLNIKSAIKYYEKELRFSVISDNIKRQRINDSLRDIIKDYMKPSKKGTIKNENKKEFKNMKYIKLFEDYSTDAATEIEVKPEVKPDVKPQVNPMKPPKPVFNPAPKNVEEELKKIIARYNRLKK